MAAEEFRPPWAPWVVGRYEREVDPETGLPEPTVVRLKCERCGDEHRARCGSGAPTQWVLRFAVAHAHRDPLDPLPKREERR